MRLTSEQVTILKAKELALRAKSFPSGSMHPLWDLVLTIEQTLKNGDCWPYSSVEGLISDLENEHGDL